MEIANSPKNQEEENKIDPLWIDQVRSNAERRTGETENAVTGETENAVINDGIVNDGVDNAPIVLGDYLATTNHQGETTLTPVSSMADMSSNFSSENSNPSKKMVELTKDVRKYLVLSYISYHSYHYT